MSSPASDHHCPHSPPPVDEMESLLLSNATSFHPLAPAPASPDDEDDDDPLLSSPQIENPRNPSSSSPPSTRNSFLDPPSYADVVFTPENGGGGSLSSSSSSISPSSSLSHAASARSDRLSSSLYSKITVASPQKEQESTNSLVPGAGTYVTYLITTKSSSDCAVYSVRRRFRDVVALSDRLTEAYRGFFVPVRPDKNVVESQVMQKQEFVEHRRSALEKYLCRLAAHPVIGRSDELRLFLQAQGKMPLPTSVDISSRVVEGAARLPRQLFGEAGAGSVAAEEVVQPAKGGRDLLRIFKELKQSVSNDWGGVKPAIVEEDKEFLERKEKVEGLEQQLTTASQQAESLVEAQQDIGETMGELGLAFIKLTKFETEEAVYNSQRVRAADARTFGTAAVKASRFCRELNAQTVKHLDTLHEYLGLMLAVHNAFIDRSNSLLTVQTQLSELSSLNAKAEKLETASSKIFGADKSRSRKIEELKEAIKNTDDAKCVALREYERIKENNRKELERLDKERREDFFGMLKAFVINQVGYAEKIASVWDKVVEDTSRVCKSE